MLAYKIHSTKDTSSGAVKALAEQIRMEHMSFMIFFASSKFDFKEVNRIFHEQYPDILVIGGTSQGELTEEGYTDGNLVAMSLYGDDFKMETVVVEEIKRKGMLYKKQVREKIKALGLSLTDQQLKDKFFCISLIDALSACEEKLSVMLSAAFGDQKINLVGGSCGCLSPTECYLGMNGQVYQDAAILLFVRTNKKMMIYNENIYEPVGEKHRVTAGDISQRIVKSVDGRPIGSAYANWLGMKESQLDASVFSEHPIGRTIGGKSYIASPKSMEPDGSIQFYIRVMPGSSFRLMQATDSMKKAQETTACIKSQLKHPQLILAFSCILRYIQFQKQRDCKRQYDELRKAAPVFGITTLGEQIGLTPVNQTLTLLAIGE